MYAAKNPEKAKAACKRRDANGMTAGLRHYYRNREACIAAGKKFKAERYVRDPLWNIRNKLRRDGVVDLDIPPKPAACPVCGSAEKIVLDHCHTTKRIRGWLCDLCNQAIGRAKDNPAVLEALAEYLRKK